MTLSDIEAMDCDFLVPAQVAETLKCDPQFIRVQAKIDPDVLGFAVCVQGHRVKIPRQAFIHWMKYGKAPVITCD